ncbi:MAG: dienelactone hydrolase family protein [Alphaproteobacteria bacterium]|nr:dienelactone hydrolase family protein [Alphaproteobacteria bacterium]
MATIIRDTKAGLSTLIRQPEEGETPDRLVIFLHGWGADGADLMELAPAIAMAFPKAMFLAPDGPEPCSANPMGRQWFPLDVDQAAIDQGPDQAMPALDALITTMLAETGLGLGDVYLIGFSQGGMMALHVSTRLSAAIGGVVSFSGALLAPEKLAAEITAKPRVLLVHGRDDEVVPFQAMAIAEAVLGQSGVDVTAVARDGLGHGIDPDGFRQAVEFIGG